MNPGVSVQNSKLGKINPRANWEYDLSEQEISRLMLWKDWEPFCLQESALVKKDRESDWKNKNTTFIMVYLWYDPTSQILYLPKMRRMTKRVINVVNGKRDCIKDLIRSSPKFSIYSTENMHVRETSTLEAGYPES